MVNAPIKPLIVPKNQSAANQNLFDSDVELKDFFEPFILSIRAANCKKATIQFYQWQLSYFFDWLNENECSSLTSITFHIIRSYIAER